MYEEGWHGFSAGHVRDNASMDPPPPPPAHQPTSLLCIGQASMWSGAGVLAVCAALGEWFVHAPWPHPAFAGIVWMWALSVTVPFIGLVWLISVTWSASEAIDLDASLLRPWWWFAWRPTALFGIGGAVLGAAQPQAFWGFFAIGIGGGVGFLAQGVFAWHWERRNGWLLYTAPVVGQRQWGFVRSLAPTNAAATPPIVPRSGTRLGACAMLATLTIILPLGLLAVQMVVITGSIWISIAGVGVAVAAVTLYAARKVQLARHAEGPTSGDPASEL